MENIEVQPDPKRLITGLRDTGYTFNVAVADLVDNSISANAKNIYITMMLDYIGEVYFQIRDDGHGMDKDALISGMRYGSPRHPDPRSLSKFGLGMKTASTSFCRCLSVVSRGNGDPAIHKAIWDLDHVEAVGKWELLIGAPTLDEVSELETICGDGSGTLVSWSKVDRLLKKYADPTGAAAQKAFDRIIEGLKEHLNMVYQRFLNVDDPREPQKIRIWVNNIELNYWDPFCEDIVSPAQVIEMSVNDEMGNYLGKFKVRAFIVPRREEFANPERAKLARISNEYQGIYVYRENRLIHDRDWLGMYSSEPHFSLLRVEFSFDSILDEPFQVDIKKSRIMLSSGLLQWLKDDFLPPVRRQADENYRKGKKKVIAGQTDGAHGSSNRNIQDKVGDIEQAIVQITDPESNEVTITSSQGVTTHRIVIESIPRNPGEFYVDVVDSIDDGLLWQPALIDQKQAVQINRGHPYYQKVYVPCILENRSGNVTIEGMDALLWALSIAELKVLNDNTKEYFNTLRYEVSRILRKLVENLPEPAE